MADPYATRNPDLTGRPDGPTPWEREVVSRGGLLVGPGGAADLEEGGEAAFLVVPCCGIGTLAPLADLDAPMAVLLWLEHVAAPRDAGAAAALLGLLRDFDGPVYAIKQGAVGGPDDRPGCSPVEPALIATLLEAREAIGWEDDPDFNYRVPASVPGLGDPAARMLLPRLLYADNDRVYEHAGLVADKKRERHDIASAVSGLDRAVIAASGWPAPATSGDWRD